eukprot:CAMPEP_0197627124 /NCGR_PEP_ID=MMETSP1338-20131121/5818_1 /TAXON_ID=43686 ORGANISM="Pelagodinium beii, Strain RCC1491" /NCGR_SAMPLE_ID=MMETSP1338 /ASSEMBLY_ACC=CAM_ASM_000754 /LENGTH=385 /DNA_ID=CAMNT_0043197749 /DNA_START=44 /DNA_END=1198 /DNA_ORIENTATION=+
MAAPLVLGMKTLANNQSAFGAEALETSGRGLEARASLYSIALKKNPKPQRKKSPRDAEVEQNSRTSEETKSDTLVLYHSQLLTQACREQLLGPALLRLDMMTSRGLKPDSIAYNEFVELMVQSGRLEEAEDWLQRPQHPALYPALANVRLNEVSYNAVLTGFGELRDLPRAERYATEMQGLGLPMTVQSFTELVRTCLAENEVRRAHRWSCLQVEKTGPGKPNKDVIAELVTRLAENGNTSSANYWLKYMEDHSQPLNGQIYDLVRHHTPQEIVPTGLFAEGGYARAPVLLPAIVGRESKQPPAPSAAPATIRGLEEGAGDVEKLMLESVSTPKPSPRSPRKGVPKILVASGGLAMKVMRADAREWGKPQKQEAPKRKSVVAERW